VEKLAVQSTKTVVSLKRDENDTSIPLFSGIANRRPVFLIVA